MPNGGGGMLFDIIGSTSKPLIAKWILSIPLAVSTRGKSSRIRLDEGWYLAGWQAGSTEEGLTRTFCHVGIITLPCKCRCCWCADPDRPGRFLQRSNRRRDELWNLHWGGATNYKFGNARDRMPSLKAVKGKNSIDHHKRLSCATSKAELRNLLRWMLAKLHVQWCPCS